MGVRLVVRPESADPGREPLVYEFDQTRIVIGRAGWADVRLPDLTVSGHHATILIQGAGYAALDENSTNGTSLGTARLVPGRPRPLRNGDVLALAGFLIEFNGSVPIGEVTHSDRTAALARRLLREAARTTRPEPARLAVVEGPDKGKTLELPSPPARLMLGRAAQADLLLTDAEVSREAVEIEVDLDAVTVRDLGGKNAMLVNGKPVAQKRLRDGDVLIVGSTSIVFEDPADWALKALDDKPDAIASPPADGALTAAANDALNTVSAAPSLPPSTPPARAGTAEILIYGLAVLVLVASFAGLVFLIRAH